MDKNEIKAVLELHKKWSNNENGGKRADLSGADLSGAKIEFINFPSIKMLASFELGFLSDALTLELMRRDAWTHPKVKNQPPDLTAGEF